MTKTEGPQRSLVILKPDAVERNLIGEVIATFEKSGLVVKEMEMRIAEDSTLRAHYPDSLAAAIGEKGARAGVELPSGPLDYGRQVLARNREYMKRGMIVVMILEGRNAISHIREIVGYTDPDQAASDSLRGRLGQDSIERSSREGRATENLVHASGSLEEAAEEIALWFPEFAPKWSESD